MTLRSPKASLAVLFFCLLFTSLNAQIILSEDFEVGSPPTGWTLSSNSPSVGWEFGTDLTSLYVTFSTHTRYAASNDDEHDAAGATTNLANVDYLISPTLNLAPYTGTSVIVEFEYVQPGTYGSSGSVEVSLDGGSSWILVETLPVATDWTGYSVDLTAYTGLSILLGFHHDDGGAWADAFGVDDVVVTALSANDGTVASLDIPENALLAPFTLSGDIQNLGGTALTSYTLNYAVDGGTTFSQTFSGLSIPTLGTHTFTHSTPITFPASGTYEICAWISNVNGAGPDSDITNDTLCETISVVSSAVTRYPLLEVSMGDWGGWNPDGQVVAEQIVATNPETAWISIHSSDAISTTSGAAFLSDYSFSFPMASIDRVLFDGESEVPLSRNNWPTRVGERLPTLPSASVGIDSYTFNSTTRELSVVVSATFVTTKTGDFRFNLFILEDSVTGFPQVNFYSSNGAFPSHPYFSEPDPDPDFIHRNVLRASMGGAYGVVASLPGTVTDGSTYTDTYVYTVPASYDESKLRLVGVVQEFNLSLLEREIINSSGFVDVDACVPPVANFSSAPSGLAVNFTDITTNSPTSWSWDFGDGGSLPIQNPSYTYAAAGTYSVCLTSTNACGSDIHCQSITVGGPPLTAVRRPILEVAMGTWSGFCPDGDVVGDAVLASYPDAVRVGVHGSDPMEVAVGSTLIADYGLAYPVGLIDRYKFPVETSTDIGSRGDWNLRMGERMAIPADVGVEVTSFSFNSLTRQLDVTVEGTFVSNLTGDFRFNVYVIEDSVTGGSTYDQSNFYSSTAGASGGTGHPFYSSPNPIPGYFHRYVLRDLLGGTYGSTGVIPGSVSIGSVYSQTFTTTLPATYDESNVSVVGVVQEFSGSLFGREILNSSGYEPLFPPSGCSTPVASFGHSSSGLAATFTDASTFTPTSWSWDFGDGGSLPIQNPSYTYSSAGTYTVCLIATNACGSDTSCQTITIAGPPPTAVRRPVLEVGTGAWLGFAPDGDLIAEQVLATYPDAVRVDIHNGDVMETPDGLTFLTDYTSAYPTGFIDRNKFPTESEVGLSRAVWSTRMGDRLATTADVAVEITSFSFNPTIRQLDMTVQGTFVNSLTGDLRFNVYIVEDSVTGGSPYNQVNFYSSSSSAVGGTGHPYYSAADPIVGYPHRYVLRAMMGGSYGTSGIIPGTVGVGSVYSHSYTTTLPAGVDENKVALIGIVQEYSGVDLNSREILNSSGYEWISAPPCVAPTAGFTFGTTGTVATFTDISSVDVTSWSWNFGDGNTSSATSPVHTYAASGTYTACLTVTNACSTNTICNSVTVSSGCPTPSANYSFSAAGSTVNFTDLSTNSPIAWTWDFGDGGTSSVQNPVHTFATGGTYTVCLTAINGCGPNTNCIPLTVTCTSPSAAFSSSSSGTAVTFTDASLDGPTSWSWTFGDGGTSSLENPVYTYASSGVYTVCLTATNSCGSNTLCQPTTVTCAPPSAGFSSTGGLSIDFTDTSINGPTSWSWTFGDGGSSTVQNPSHTYGSAGTYTVCLSATNSCGTNTTCQSVTSTCVAPAAAFSNANTGLMVSFTDFSTNTPTSWSWTFGDGGSSTDENPIHTYASPGVYTVCLIATNSCGSNTACLAIDACAPPVSGFSSLDLGGIVNFTDMTTNSPTTWLWTFGDGGSDATPNPVHTYVATGSYTVCLTASNSCGTNTSCSTISVLITDVPEVEALAFSVYPNPNTGRFFFEIDLPQSDQIQFSVTDLRGVKVYESSIDANAGTLKREVDLGAVSNGVYFLRVRTSLGEKVVKVMKQ